MKRDEFDDLFVVHEDVPASAWKGEDSLETLRKSLAHACDVCGAPGAREVICFLRRADGVTRPGYKHMLCEACDAEWNH